MEKIIDKSTNSETTDRVGILISVLCCIHCMALPLFIVFFPALGSFFQNEIIHAITIGLVVPIGLFSFITKLKVHNNKTPLLIGIFGMIALLSGHLFHEFVGGSNALLVEIIGSVVGGSALIFAHVYNVKLCRCSTCKH